MNTGLVSATDLGTWTARAFNEFGWYAGVMFWQYSNDITGSRILAATSSLKALYIANPPVEPEEPETPEPETETPEPETETP